MQNHFVCVGVCVFPLLMCSFEEETNKQMYKINLS